MSKLFKSPKALAIIAAVLVLFVVSLAGGALGNEFGGGFLAAPIAHIQLPAEPVFADELFPGFKLTNTMVATFLTIIVLTVLSYLATRRMAEVPTGLQNLFEAVIEFFSDLATSIAGPRKRQAVPPAGTDHLHIHRHIELAGHSAGLRHHRQDRDPGGGHPSRGGRGD